MKAASAVATFMMKERESEEAGSPLSYVPYGASVYRLSVPPCPPSTAQEATHTQNPHKRNEGVG